MNEMSSERHGPRGVGLTKQVWSIGDDDRRNRLWGERRRATASRSEADPIAAFRDALLSYEAHDFFVQRIRGVEKVLEDLLDVALICKYSTWSYKTNT